MSDIEYQICNSLSAEEFIEVLTSSTLAERRPVHDLECIRAMVEHANLIVCARHQGKLVGVARSVTDFNYCCYLSDLAVDKKFQHQGIGKQLIKLTKDQLGKYCRLILLSAPAAAGFYPKIGFKHHDQAWYVDQADEIH